MIKYLTSVIIILVLCGGCFLGGYIYRGKEDASVDKPAPIEVKPISGAPVKIKTAKYTGKKIIIDEIHDGPGESIIEIPKGNIPEVRNWLDRVHGYQLGVNYTWFTNRFHASADAMYFHRWGSISLGGGAVVGDGVYGIKLAIQYWR